MDVNKFIDQFADEAPGHPLVEEMQFYNEHPEVLKEGDMTPNFENMEPEMRDAVYHWYIGVIFGIGIANKHDLQDI